MTNDVYAREIIRAGKDQGITPRGIVIAFATVFVESNWKNYANSKVPESLALPHDAVGSDGKSVGLFQQQVVWGNGWWWGDAATCMDPYKSAVLFFQRLKKLDYNNTSRSPGSYAQDVQKSAFPDRYGQRMAEAQRYYDRLTGGSAALTPEPGFSGDPWWLAEVLRDEGLRVFEVDGWQNRGQGDQGRFWGVVFHHTGSPSETPEGIAFHPTLGLAAHILIRPNGDVWVCGIGKANHAGKGSWWGVPTDNGNPVLLGVEVAILPREGAPHRSGWPDVQYDATVKVHAALLRKLGLGSDRVISHKEWAQLGPAGWRQGKWDPGAIDMNVFRADVQAQINSKTGDDPLADPDVVKKINEIHACLFNQIPSKSKYRDLNEGNKWQLHQLIGNDDAMIHEMLVERQAMMGNPEALALVKREADKGDKWAAVVYQYCTEAPE
ncbi:lysin A [Mycobacterium phage Nebkiss]|nr:lysin A [Mycobacterium phage Nebkiss]